MTFLEKLRAGVERSVAPPTSPKSGAAAATAPEVNRRASSGLKDFLWLLSDVKQGSLLDLGPVSQATVNFFTERTFRIYSDDLMRAWQEFLKVEETRLRGSSTKPAETGEDAQFTRAVLARRFLETSVQYPLGTFHAILVWDLFDYLDEEVLPLLAARLYALLRPGGVVLGLFHSKKPESSHRYRISDAETIEVVPGAATSPPLRQFQNRDLMNLFSAFRSSKTFVGRDQLREALFLK